MDRFTYSSNDYFFTIKKKEVLVIFFLLVKFDNIATDDKKVKAFCKRIDIPYINNKGRNYYLYWVGEKIKQMTIVTLQMIKQPRIMTTGNVTIIITN